MPINTGVRSTATRAKISTIKALSGDTAVLRQRPSATDKRHVKWRFDSPLQIANAEKTFAKIRLRSPLEVIVTR